MTGRRIAPRTRTAWYLAAILALLVLSLPACARPAEASARLGEEFTLAIGQVSGIAGEDLRVKFIEVVTDSRCPEGAVCIWAGQASSLVELTHAKTPNRLVLTQPDGTGSFLDYEIAFDLQPYPQVGRNIEDKDYRLKLKITRKSP